MRISIVLATYNGEKYITEQLNSLLKQSVVPDEIIIVDDCSCDNTNIITDKWISGCNTKIEKINHESNCGVVKSFFDGLKVAKGDIVFFCDQDDVWNDKKIQLFIEAFESNPTKKLVFSNATVVDEKLSSKGYSLWDTIGYAPDLNYMQEMLKRNLFTGMCMAMNREWAIADINIPKFMLHDEFFGWRSVMEGCVTCLDKELALYRQHGKNVIGANHHSKFESLQNMKGKIEKNTSNSLNKFRFLYNYTDNDDLKNYFDKAASFYEYRCAVYEKGFFRSCAEIMKNIRR